MLSIDITSDARRHRDVVRQLMWACLSSDRLPTECFFTGPCCISERAVSLSAFSDVFCGQGYRRQLAVKVLRVHTDERDRVWKVSGCADTSDTTADDALQAYMNEVLVWMCLRHPNVVPFVGVPVVSHFMGDVVLISEWMSEGTISSHLQRHPHKYRGKFVRVRLTAPTRAD
jgi:hypothetical protein